MRGRLSRVRHKSLNLLWNIKKFLVLDFFSFLAILRFFRHTTNVFGKRGGRGNRSQVLLELNSLYFSHPGYTYLSSVLCQEFGASPVAYSAYASQKPLGHLIFRIKSLLPMGKFLSYRAMGVSGFLKPTISRADRRLCRGEAARDLSKLKTKADLEDLVLEGVYVGDLIYGAFISAHREPTVMLDDPRLLRLVAEFRALLNYWTKYFDTHEVRAVVASHLVYEMGLAVRVGLMRGIDCFHFVDTGTALTRVTPAQPFYGAEHEDFLRDYARLSADEQEKGRALAAQKLRLRFSGFGDPDLNPASASAYRLDASASQPSFVFTSDDSFRVLIAGQLYWDSPHKRGKSLFPDFYEWLIFLGEKSKNSPYSWYLKRHPDGLGHEDWLYEELLRLYPHITLIPSDITHHQIFSEGVDVALTVHGTIGFEYPLHGIRVVNASKVNPHIAYEFSLTPESLSHYEHVLKNLHLVDYQISHDQVTEYYFMKNVFYTPNIFFRDFQGEVRGPMTRNSPRALVKWVEEHSPEKHERLRDAVTTFVTSGDRRLHWKHYGLAGPDEHLF